MENAETRGMIGVTAVAGDVTSCLGADNATIAIEMQADYFAFTSVYDLRSMSTIMAEIVTILAFSEPS